jgi:hypothetical protein
MKRLYFFTTILFVSAIILMTGSLPVSAGRLLPIAVSGDESPTSYSVFLPALINGSQSSAKMPPVEADEFDLFIDTVTNGVAEQLVGVYAEDVLAMPVVQQPNGNSGYISSAPNTITQFAAANNFGNTGLLAHNTHAGAKFYHLTLGQEIEIVFGDSSIKTYRIESIRQFQALEPNSPYSDFIDLESNERLTASQLFYQMYTGDHHLTFQTCLKRDGNASWGRTFVLATPIL